MLSESWFLSYSCMITDGFPEEEEAPLCIIIFFSSGQICN